MTQEATFARGKPDRLWGGRALALVGIVLIALSLRTAIASVSPIVSEINAEISLDGVRLGIIGMLPPACFAVFGLFSPLATRSFGLESTTILAIALMVVGHLGRAIAINFDWFLVGSILTFAGTGIGNALLPPLVKRYFPDRIGTLTSLYAGALSVSAFLPPLVAVPIANSAAGWRVSLGLWGVFATFAAIPWLLLLAKRPSRNRDAAVIARRPGLPIAVLRRSGIAWSILIVFASSSMTMYAVFAWLPVLLVNTAGVSALGAGALLALYAAVGFPAAVVVPILVSRVRSVGAPIIFGVSCVCIGIMGLLLAPSFAPWLWVVLISMGRLLYPVAMTLINLRARSHEDSLSLSSFVNGVGYVFGMLGPFLFGLLHEIGGGWTLPLLMLFVPAIAAAIVAFPLGQSGMIENSGQVVEPS